VPYLSSEETQLFKEEGYLLRNDLLSSDLIEAAQEATWEGLEVDRTDPATWFGGGHACRCRVVIRSFVARSYDSIIRPLFELTYLPFAWLFSDTELADMLADRGFQQGYLYSGLYTVLMAWCGYEALIRWRGIARRKAYQTWRFVSLISFQVISFLLVNVVAVQALSTQYAWRAWGLYQLLPPLL